MSSRIHLVTLTTLAALTTVLATGCSRTPAKRPQPPVPVLVAPAVRLPVPNVLTTNGVVEPMQTVAVESQVGGILMRVAFTEGQDVVPGQVLFQIDPRPFQAALAQARGQLQRDEAQAANARRDSSRYAQLVRQDYVTQSQADQAAATAASTQATVQADRAAVERAALDLANCTIRAPIAGRTGSLLVRQGNLVKANSTPPLVVINQIRPILVRFSVPQSELPTIQRYFGGHVPLPVRAAPSEGAGNAAEGTLAFVDNAVDSATGTVLLKARFANSPATLWPGQFVTVALQLSVDTVLTVPSRAVLTGQQGSYVFTVDSGGNNARQRPVQVARTVDTLAVIRGGIAPGDRVIVDGQSRIVPGARVVVRAPGQHGAPAGAAPGGPGAPATDVGGATIPAQTNGPGTTPGSGAGTGTPAAPGGTPSSSTTGTPSGGGPQ